MRNRNVKIQVWLSKKEAENLQKKAKRSHISVAAYLRHLINDMVPQEAPPPDYYSMAQQLCGGASCRPIPCGRAW